MSTETGLAESGETVGNKLAAARRYWWVVLIVVWLALLGGLLATVRTPTTYLGRTSLIVSSSDRSPEQDAVLVQGYVTYFNNLPYQQQLLAEAGMGSAIEVTAEAAAASPIVVISATAPDSETAQSAAIAVARVFRNDINKTHDQKMAAALASLQDQLDTALGRNGKDDQAVIAALQDRIRQLQSDQDNVLQDLQVRGGVTEQPPSLLTNLGLALPGGLLLGVLAALALARLSPSVRSRYDVANKVGVNTLVELPARPTTNGARLLRDQRLRQVANILRARLARPGVVAVTQSTAGAAAGVVARGLAIEWANQGYTTVLVRFGSGTNAPPSQVGKVAAPLGPAEVATALSKMRSGPVAGMSVLDLRPFTANGEAALPIGKVDELLKLETLAGAFVVLETPAVIRSADAQAASLAADAAIIVIDTRTAKVAETREAVGMLQQSGVAFVGAVLAPMRTGENSLDDDDLSDSNGAQPPWSTVLSGPSDPNGWSWGPTVNGSPSKLKVGRSPSKGSMKKAEQAAQNGSTSPGVQADEE